jgi:N-acetylglutamate synthase-like GNAT family acetyltransferase
MQINEATHSDIPEIVSLLKVSLGESLMPKSDAYWRWKHVENPFGESPVLVARMDGKIVGVRAFMRWSWESEWGRINAMRAVDTATHPQYQGKGIFNKLTMALLDQCRLDGVSLIFNTPNSKSLPGYLKMGWIQAGKYPLRIRLVRPLSMAKNLLLKKEVEHNGQDESSATYFLNHPGMSRLLSLNREFHRKEIITAHTRETLLWRYTKVTVAQYFAAGMEVENDLNAVFFYRIKVSKLGRELRVTDLFLANQNYIRQVNLLLKEKVILHRVDFVTFSGVAKYSPFGGSLNFRHSLGPIVTVRDVQENKLDQFHSFDKWSPSLGDLELF